MIMILLKGIAFFTLIILSVSVVVSAAVVFWAAYEWMIKSRGILRNVLLTMNISGVLLLVFSVVFFKLGDYQNGINVLFLGGCLFLMPIDIVCYVCMYLPKIMKAKQKSVC